MPKPIAGETRKKYIPRCMGDAGMNREYPDQAQRAAVCNSYWRNRGKNAREEEENVNELDWGQTKKKHKSTSHANGNPAEANNLDDDDFGKF